MIEIKKNQNIEDIDSNILDRLVNVLKKIEDSYSNILRTQKYLPTRDQIGFTERNLTFYFCHHYLEVRKDEEPNYNMNNLIVWQEMPLNKNERQHIDSIIIDKDKDKNEVSFFYIEAKRVYDKSFINGDKSSLGKDRERIESKYMNIPGYEELIQTNSIHRHYEILLAGLEIRNNQKDKTINERKDALIQFSKDFGPKGFYCRIINLKDIPNNEKLDEYRIYMYLKEF